MTGQRKPPGGPSSGQIEVTVRTQRLRQRMLTGHVEQIALDGIAHRVQRQVVAAVPNGSSSSSASESHDKRCKR